MRLPNKITPFQESVISRFPIVLSLLEQEDLSASTLYESVKTKTEDVGDFVDILDCLFALGKIELIKETRLLHYVDRDQM